jgi:hypothetical protein
MPQAYRVVNLDGPNGLWYDKDGRWNPIITEINGKAAHLPMGYDPNMKLDHKAWLSATLHEKELLDWFSVDDLFKLQERGYGIWTFEVKSYREVPGHIVITEDQIITAKRTPLDIYLLNNLTFS